MIFHYLTILIFAGIVWETRGGRAVDRIFSPDSRIYRFFQTVGELFILNLLYLLTCLPAVTVGVSTAALCQTVFSMQKGNGGLFRLFFSVWRDEWKQATAVWLILLVFLLPAAASAYFLPGAPSLPGIVVTALLVLTWLGVFGWVFPLMARFRNRTAVHLRNALLLSFAHLFRTLMMALSLLVPVVMLVLFPYWFLRLGFIWFTVGLALICYSNCKLIAPVLRQLEGE